MNRNGPFSEVGRDSGGRDGRLGDAGRSIGALPGTGRGLLRVVGVVSAVVVSVVLAVAVMAQGAGDCYVGLVVEPGRSCTYPGTDVEFRVDDSGSGRLLFFSSGQRLELRATSINGVEYTFVASRQPGGGWLIEEIGGGSATTAAATTSTTAPPPAPGVVTSGGFSDVRGTTHEEAIRALEADGVFEGTECGPDMFCPRDPVQRWVLAVWLVRLLDGGDPPAVGTSRFADVDASQWWAPYVERLADLGVTTGCDTQPARFCPNETTNRARMASFLVRAFDLPSGPPAGFADVEGGAHAAHIDALAASGITSGCKTQPLRYCPKRDTTRAQMATFLTRARTGAAGVTSAEEITRAHHVIVRVVVVDPGWHGFDVRGGWPAAVAVRESESLKYFEVAAWEERNAIHFYEFDNDFDPFGWDSPVETVTANREKYVIQRNVGLPGPWSPERSTFIRQAFASLRPS